MRVKSQFVASAEINGKLVSFFTPPHDEPDFLWVDVEELAKAFLPRAAARKMVKHAQSFDRSNRAAETTAHDGRIRTIVSHPMAKGMCGAVDNINGQGEEDDGVWGGGPCETAYSVAMAKVQHDHRPLGFDGLLAAFKNQGGPNMRGFKEEGAQ